jgi:simple sugar transport system permease protein
VTTAPVGAEPPGVPAGEGVARLLAAAVRAMVRAANSTLFPFLAVLLAFAMGGLVVLFTGNDPLNVYRALWVGAGFDYPFHWLPGNPLGVDTQLAAFNLQQTLNTTTPLILAGLAVAFAFRAGLFNIGGTGQYWAGGVMAFFIADEVPGLPGPLLIVIALLGGVLAGAAWGAIPGYLKAARGAHEVISTIMLNYIAIYIGQYLFGLNGPLKGPGENPISVDVPARAQYPQLWGDIQGVHTGLFIALGAAVVFSLIIRRTTLGYEVRAVGLNPDAARAGGIRVGRMLVITMAISGAFAGLAGTGEVLGVNHHVAANEFLPLQIGFTGIAVALLGRNTAIGTVFSALLFGALISGSNNLQSAFSTDLATALAEIVQGMIILFVSAEFLIRLVIRRRRHPEAAPVTAEEAAPE